MFCMVSLKLIAHVLGEYAEKLVGLVWQILFGLTWLCLPENEMLVFLLHVICLLVTTWHFVDGTWVDCDDV